MKKYLFLFVAIAMAAGSISSCLDSDNNSADASVDFGANLDSIIFDDPADTVFFEAVDTALQDLGVVSSWNSGLPTKLFTEKSTVNVSSIPYAIAVACSQATTTYQKRWDAVTLESLKKHMQLADYPAPLPVDSLDGFSYYTSLIYAYSSATYTTVKTFSKSFQ